MDADMFLRFAETAEKIRGTTKRLEKATHLAAYFSTLDDSNLLYAVRYFAGYTFSLRDQRVIAVGGAALITAVLTITNVEEMHFRSRLVVFGDLGDAVEEAFRLSPQTALAPTLTLEAVAAFLEELATLSGTKRKIERLIGFLRHAGPLEAKYLVKLMSHDLRIGLKEGAVEDAIARIASVPVAHIQWTNMLIGDIGETALLARHQQLDTAQMRLFHPIKFMLATPAEDLTDVARQFPNGFAVEDKYDGIRAQAHIASVRESEATLHGMASGEKRVALFSRTLDEITESFPDLVAPLAALLAIGKNRENGLVLDGELVPVRGAQILPFQQLQPRLGRKTPTEAMLAASPVAFVAYDLLYADGLLLDAPFSARRARLETLPVDGDRVRITPSRTIADIGPLNAEFEQARGRGNEGLMVKDPNATYKPGRRGREWLKIKRALATLDVVVTAVEVGNGRRNTVLSDYTFAVRAAENDPTLLNVGKAYSGLTDLEIAELSVWFREHTLQEFAHGKVRMVEPKIVLEVTFDRVQPSTRHKSGYALRFPRIVRVRDDKPVEQIDTIETVRRLAELSGATCATDQEAES